MAPTLERSPDFERHNRTLCAKNGGSRGAVRKKVEQILLNPLLYKPLLAPLQSVRRAHMGVAFVIMFEPDEERQSSGMLRLAHHDDACGI